ncbi:ankyrin repeat-containing protein [Fusarium heterosporum]|uniref:Ankyrin repeat-containing protein n=1 Tax=Fusarium heterosporum TaxID=42747 RepID=A0A8H5T1H0_FUSHE|nr:ankyrin repeat-containing protein [Fusarium heterosporum]
MEEFDGRVLFASPKQQETQRLRERNRLAKRASRARRRQNEQLNGTATDTDATAPSAAAQDQPVVPASKPQYPSSGSDSAHERIEASSRAAEDPQPLQAEIGVWDGADLDGTFTGTLDAPLDDTTALSWPPSLDGDWPDFSASPSVLTSQMDSLNPQQLSLSIPRIRNPQPTLTIAASSSSISSDNNSSNSDGFNSKSSRLLHIAARNGTTGILLSLIKAGADVNTRDSSGTAPLHLAVRFRRVGALEVLVNHGADINARDSANMTALEVAVRAQDEELVNVLLSGGAELH